MVRLGAIVLALAYGSAALASETTNASAQESGSSTTALPVVGASAPPVTSTQAGPAGPSDEGSASPAAETATEGASPAPVARPDPIRLSPPRASLLPLAQPLWSELDRSQQQILEPFAGQWNGLPVTEKRAWADLAKRFPKMKADEQQRVSKRIAQWAALTPEQRRMARANYRLAQQVARDNVLAEWENYQAMTPEQRSVLGTAGSTSNTAARHVAAQTGLAKEAAQPLPRRAPRDPVASGTAPTEIPAGSVRPTVGPAGTPR